MVAMRGAEALRDEHLHRCLSSSSQVAERPSACAFARTMRPSASTARTASGANSNRLSSIASPSCRASPAVRRRIIDMIRDGRHERDQPLVLGLRRDRPEEEDRDDPVAREHRHRERGVRPTVRATAVSRT
jgi:hypothetical protein